MYPNTINHFRTTAYLLFQLIRVTDVQSTVVCVCVCVFAHGYVLDRDVCMHAVCESVYVWSVCVCVSMYVCVYMRVISPPPLPLP